MDGRFPEHRTVQALFMTFILCILSCVHASAEDPSMETLEHDGRITGFVSDGEENHTRQWNMTDGQWTSLMLECEQCSAELTLGELSYQTTTQLTLQATSNTTAVLNIHSPAMESVRYSLVETIDEKFPTVRPSPSEELTLQEIDYCTAADRCIDPSRGNLYGIPHGEYTHSNFITGIVEQIGSEYVPVSVTEGDTVELQIMHASEAIEVSGYFQSEGSERLSETVLALSTGLDATKTGDNGYWHAEETGRLLIKIDASIEHTAWVLKSMRYAQASTGPMVTDSNEFFISGHHTTTTMLAMNDTQKITFTPVHLDVHMGIEQLVSGSWTLRQQVNLSANTAFNFYPYPNISVARIVFDAPVHFVDVMSTDFSDIRSGLEAPSVRPLSAASENDSWPLLALETGPLEGQFTLAVHDIADVYRLEVDGWEESEHLLRFILEGNDLGEFELELWGIDQETWGVVDTRSATLSNGKITASMTVGPGTHFIRVSMVHGENLTLHNWGEDTPSRAYSVTTYYSLIDEGEEPYFPPDENAEKWGVRARFFLGSLFLLPVVYLAAVQYRTKKRADEYRLKSEQLTWFKSQLDSGATTPKQSREQLKKALQAVTLLSWDEANSTWGKPDLDYRTETLALAVWRLDERIAKAPGAKPLMIGIHILQGHWDLAALRFDAPVGQAWNVEHVEPKFLNRGEEVFLDTMAIGNRTFIMVELSGTSTAVDVELNGRIDGVPSAARIPSTLHFDARTDAEE